MVIKWTNLSISIKFYLWIIIDKWIILYNYEWTTNRRVYIDLYIRVKYPIISFDKEVISFDIEPSECPDKHGIYGKSESVILVKNLISDSVALRVKI